MRSRPTLPQTFDEWVEHQREMNRRTHQRASRVMLSIDQRTSRELYMDIHNVVGAISSFESLLTVLTNRYAEQVQRADHFEQLYTAAAQGKCGYSGMGLVECKNTICDCFSFEWLRKDDDAQLPDDVVARIDVGADERVRVNLREGMTGKDFADMLRTIADAYENGTARRTG